MTFDPVKGTGRIDDFELIGLIGKGGMGSVYRARALSSSNPRIEPGETVALKVLHADLMKDRSMLVRFQREARAGMLIESENIVHVYQMGQTESAGDELHYLVMEFVRGQTLSGLLSEVGQVGEELVVDITRQVASALGAVHSMGIIHRDIKSENILITDDYRVRLMDFGLSKFSEASQIISQAGDFIGTLTYASPEQFLKSDVDERSDLYALGIVMYELLTGENPFNTRDAAVVVHLHLNVVPEAPSTLAPAVTPFIDRLVTCLLAKNKQDRLQSAAELLDVLDKGVASDWWIASRQYDEAKPPPLTFRQTEARDTALFGRETETDRLHKIAGVALSGERNEGQVVIIEGEPGVGKTRLATEYFGTLEDAGLPLIMLMGKARMQSVALPYRPFTELLEQFFGIGDLEAASRESIVSENLLQLMPEIKPLVDPFTDFLLGRAPQASTGAAEGVALTEESLLHIFSTIFGNISAECPLLLFLDDFQWADDGSLRVLSYLARAIQKKPILIVLTLPNEEHRAAIPGAQDEAPLLARMLEELQPLENCHLLGLERLGAGASEEIVTEFLALDTVEKRALELLHLRSEGNPFFLLETLKFLSQEHVFEQEDGAAANLVSRIESVETPQSILELVSTRLKRVSDEERELLEFAAVQGPRFISDVLAYGLEMNRIQLLRKLSYLEKRHGLIHSRERHFVFDHQSVQATLYGETMPELREEYHALIAQFLEEQKLPGDADNLELKYQIAHHYSSAGRHADALRFILDAISYLMGKYSNRQALDLSEKALTHIKGAGAACEDPLMLRFRVLEMRQTLFNMLGKRDGQLESIEELIGIAKEKSDDRLLGDALSHLAIYRHQTGEMESATETVNEALGIKRELSDRPGIARCCNTLGIIHYYARELDQAREYYDQAREISEELENHRWRAISLNNIGNILAEQSEFDQAVEHFQGALGIARARSDRQTEAMSLYNLGRVHHNLRRYAESLEYQQRGLALAREIGSRRNEAHLLMAIADTHTYLGSYHKAEKLWQSSLDILHEISDQTLISINRGHYARNQQGMNRLDEALTIFEASLEAGETRGDNQLVQNCLNSLAIIRSVPGWQSSDPAAALRFAERAVLCAEQQGGRSRMGEARTAQGHALLAADRPEEALEAAHEGMELLEKEASTSDTEEALLRACHVAARALKTLGRDTEATAALEKGRTLLMERINQLDAEFRQVFAEKPVNRAILAGDYSPTP